MDNYSYEEQRVIEGLIKLLHHTSEPRDLERSIYNLNKPGARFLQQVYEDLHTKRRSKYSALTSNEFRQFLVAEYRQQAQIDAECQTQARLKADVERLAQAQAEAERRAQAQAEQRAQAQAEAEHQAQIEKEKCKKDQRRARTDFDALGEEMAKTTIRSELIQLGRKRKALTHHTGISYGYETHCWKCHEHISSAIYAKCPGCPGYICSCGSCLCGYVY